MEIPIFDVVFLIAVAYFYDITRKCMEIFGNHNGSADKGCDPKLCNSAEFCINLCTIHFYDLFAKYRSLNEKYSFKEYGSREPSV